MLDSNVNLLTLLTAPPLGPRAPSTSSTWHTRAYSGCALSQRPQHLGWQGPTTVPRVSLILFCGKALTAPLPAAAPLAHWGTAEAAGAFRAAGASVGPERQTSD